MDTDTPRVDAEIARRKSVDDDLYTCMTSLARDLERENAKLRQALTSIAQHSAGPRLLGYWDGRKCHEAAAAAIEP